MDPSQISSLLGDDPLGMLNAPVIENTNPTTEIQMGTQQLIQQNPPMESNQILQTQNSINSTMIPQQIPSNGYEPTLESLNQTVQVLQSQKGPQA
ncbi:hypothetical protein IJM86_03715 [bacterium]|nr:hypothetical protein [bacterium]